MKIVADIDIPFIQSYFGDNHDLILKPGRTLTHSDVLTADILIVRAVTKVNQALLDNTPVKWVGSAATGTDHLDIPWLEKAGIHWMAASGCNTVSVAHYVMAVVAGLQQRGYLNGKSRAGIIGVGRIGREVARLLQLIGCDIVLCDPIRALHEKDFASHTLDNLQECDFITLHTPLHTTGDYPTYHFIEKHFLSRQRKGCVLLNTSRGSVIDFSDLKRYGKHLLWCLDVWENEPHIDESILQDALLATPHIAGYSMNAKQRATNMIYQAAISQKIILPTKKTPPLFLTPSIKIDEVGDWRDQVLSLYNPFATSEKLKASPHSFDALRKTLETREECLFSN